MAGGYEPPPHCHGTFVGFKSAKRTQYTAVVIQPLRMQKSSGDEINKRELPSHHFSSHRSYGQLHPDMIGSHLPKGRDVKGLL